MGEEDAISISHFGGTRNRRSDESDFGSFSLTLDPSSALGFLQNAKILVMSGSDNSSCSTTNACAVCQAPAKNRCSRCKLVWYCGVDHQRQHWKTHKATCNDAYRADQHTLHKQAFDRIIAKYGLQDKAEEISEYITSNKASNGGLTASMFADKFGMDVEEAVVFLEWIQVGVKFKEETLDVAKKSGLLQSKEKR